VVNVNVVVEWRVTPDAEPCWGSSAGSASPEVLRLKTEAGVLHVLDAMAAGKGAIEEVTGVELHSGLGGFDGHAPAALGSVMTAATRSVPELPFTTKLWS